MDSIAELECAIDGALDRAAPDSWAFARDLIARMRPRDVAALVCGVLSEPERLARCVASSSPHGNGFDKIVLGSSLKHGWQLRLNVWWADRAEHTENIHNHRADFASVILRGSYTADYFRHDSAGEPLHCWAYEPVPEAGLGPGAFRMRYRGLVTMVKTHEERFGAGDDYVLHRNMFHRVRPECSVTTATLVLRSRSMPEPAFSMASELVFPDASVSSASFDLESLSDRLKRIGSLLAS